jgi:hypothetical protein
MHRTLVYRGRAMNGGQEGAQDAAPRSADIRRVALGAGAGLALAIVLWGGYSHHWSWTGINGGTATLWDWLHLLLLPLAFSVVPVWFSRDTRVHPRTKAAGATAVALFGVVIILGYTIPWAWTGFLGNTLWDWINLVLLPFTVVAIPRLLEFRATWGTRHSLVALTVVTAFAALVLGGYLGSWGWTGFTGNTLWNWLNLLLLPLLVPAVLVPSLKPIATARVVYVDADGNPIVEPAADAEQPPAPVEADAVEPESESPGAQELGVSRPT